MINSFKADTILSGRMGVKKNSRHSTINLFNKIDKQNFTCVIKYFCVYSNCLCVLLLYCDAKHSDTLRRSSHVDCYLPRPPCTPTPTTTTTTTISKIFKRGLKNFFWSRGELNGKGVINYWREGTRFLEIGLTKFTSRLLFDLLGIP